MEMSPGSPSEDSLTGAENHRVHLSEGHPLSAAEGHDEMNKPSRGMETHNLRDKIPKA